MRKGQIVRAFALIASVLMLPACAAIEISKPLTGKFRGRFMSGFATARGDGNGSFWVQTRPGGLRCEGKYNSLNTARELTAEVTCNDGRTGTVEVERKPNLLGGIALMTLNDGSKGQFVFGDDVRYEEEFADAGAAAHAAAQ